MPPRETTVTYVSTESFDALSLREAPFGCRVHRHGHTSEIELEGELDLAAKPTLDDAILTALHPGPVETLIVDFTGVTFADSTTVNWLLRADSSARATNGRLVAVVAPGPVRDLLTLTGLDERIALVANGPMR
jgi:anti-sigma B factor antagonist